jgi:hypothetical protein
MAGNNGSWKILFTLELNVDEGGWELGGFMCFFWPEAYAQPGASKAHEATLVLLKAAGADTDPKTTGLPDVEEIHKFLNYTSMRAMFDNKASNPLMLNVDREITRDQMEEIISTTDRKTLKRWRSACNVKFLGSRVRPVKRKRA